MKIVLGIILGIMIVAWALFLLAKYEPELQRRAIKRTRKKFDRTVRRGNIAVVRKMLEKNVGDRQKGLLVAAQEQNVEMMKLFIEEGADVNRGAQKGDTTPLKYALLRTNVQMVRFLIDQGADVNLKDPNGLTPLQLAEQTGVVVPEEIKEILKKAGAK